MDKAEFLHRMNHKMGYYRLASMMNDKDISCSEIARALKLDQEEFLEKLAGNQKFTMEQALTIQQIFFPEKPLAYIFGRK